MTSPSFPQPKNRSRVAWLIGIVVLLGVGAVVWVNWEKASVAYIVLQVRETVDVKNRKMRGYPSDEIVLLVRKRPDVYIPALVEEFKNEKEYHLFARSCGSVFNGATKESLPVLLDQLEAGDRPTKVFVLNAMQDVAINVGGGKVKEKLIEQLLVVYESGDRGIRTATKNVLFLLGMKDLPK